ncbi:hypothetical protein F5X68DRAFT_205902 [Plectosphaerella plurivora]|uniref:Uncharacterized protein n=1 Tax=Plectosphaerella plurivora TaxID=936078 RepID=A0A9P8VF44_9PEZI|nr:hypothetical protein F5X68DRAFT_205902 [Plectosphaerella plurivora]
MPGAERPIFSPGYVDDRYYPTPSTSTASIVSSRTNSTGGRSRQESIFSNKSHRSNSSASSAPSTHAAALPFDLLQAGYIPEASLIDPDLPCDFFWIDNCDKTFRHDELQLCIEHVQNEHFKSKHPHTLSCWWCDDIVFDAEEMDIPEETVFECRMTHIYEHVIHGGYSLTRKPRRQDLHLLKFLMDNGLISGDRFGEYYQSEMPPPPGMKVCDAGRKPKQPLSASSCIHNNEKEERQRKRERRKEKEARTRR